MGEEKRVLSFSSEELVEAEQQNARATSRMTDEYREFLMQQLGEDEFAGFERSGLTEPEMPRNIRMADVSAEDISVPDTGSASAEETEQDEEAVTDYDILPAEDEEPFTDSDDFFDEDEELDLDFLLEDDITAYDTEENLPDDVFEEDEPFITDDPDIDYEDNPDD